MTGRSGERRQWTSVAQLYSARIFGLVVGAGLSVVAARLLGPESQGSFATLKSAVLLGAQAVNLGLSSSIALLFSRRPARAGRYRRALWVWPAAVGALLLTVGAALGAVGALAGRLVFVFLAAAWLPLQLLLIHQSAALVAVGRSRSLGFLEAGGRLASLGLGTTALVGFGPRVETFALALVTADLLTVGAGAIALTSAVPATQPSGRRRARRFLSVAFRLGLRAYPVLVIPFLLIRSDVLLVSALRGPREAGIYSVSSQLVDLGLVLPSTIAALVLPALTRSPSPADVIRRTFRPVLLTLLVLAGVMAAAGSVGIRILFGDAYAGAYPALLLLAPGFVCLGLETVVAQYFAAQNYPPFLTLAWLAALAINVVLNLAFVPRFGFLAAAASSSVCYAFILAALLHRFRRESRLRVADLLRVGEGPA